MDYKLSEKKFRAWDKEAHHMAYQGTPDLETIQSFFFHWGDKELMLSSGLFDNTSFNELSKEEQENWLKDNNEYEWKGKQIYEGDIVEFNNPLINEVVFCEVSFKNGSFIFISCFKDGWIAKYPLDENVKYLKVIGNIFQQKER